MQHPHRQPSFDLKGSFKFKHKLDECTKRSQSILKDDFVIVGAVCLSLRGLRENSRIIICPQDDIISEIEQIKLPENVSVEVDFYSDIGLSNDEINETESYFDIVDGYKIIRPEIEFSRALTSVRTKDDEITNLLENYAFDHPEDWDWDHVRFKPNAGSNTRTTAELLTDLAFSLMNRGLKRTLFDALQHINEDALVKTQTIGENIDYISNPIQKYKMGHLADNEMDLCWGVDEMLRAQFESGEFTRMDLIAQYTAQSDATLKIDKLREEIGNDQPEWKRQDRRYQREYAKEHLVTLNSEYEIIDGEDLVFALRQSQPTIPVNFSEKTDAPIRDKTWLEQIGYKDSDIKRINNEFLNIIDKYGLLYHVILWPPAADVFDEIEAEIEEYIEIVEKDHIHIPNFEEFVREVYLAQQRRRNWKIEWKIRELTEYGNEILHLKVNPPRKKGVDEFQYLSDIKDKIREGYKSEIDCNHDRVIIHNTDNYVENRKINSILDEYGFDSFSQPIFGLHREQ